MFEWFAQVLYALEFEVSRGDEPQARPPPEKVADLIRGCDAVVAVLTRRDKVEGRDAWRPPEWVQNEIGMAYQEGRPVAAFVEDGVDLEGLAPLVTQYERFDRADLGVAAPKVVRYLVGLRGSVSAQPPAQDVGAVAQALAFELGNRGAEIAVVDQTLELNTWNLSHLYARVTGKIYLLPPEVQNKVDAAYDAIREADGLVREANSIQTWSGIRGKLGPSEATRKQEIVAKLIEAKPRILASIEGAVVALLEFVWPGLVDALREAAEKKSALPPKTGGDESARRPSGDSEGVPPPHS